MYKDNFLYLLKLLNYSSLIEKVRSLTNSAIYLDKEIVTVFILLTCYTMALILYRHNNDSNIFPWPSLIFSSHLCLCLSLFELRNLQATVTHIDLSSAKQNLLHIHCAAFDHNFSSVFIFLTGLARTAWVTHCFSPPMTFWQRVMKCLFPAYTSFFVVQNPFELQEQTGFVNVVSETPTREEN